MLLLSRAINEDILIDGTIRIIVLAIDRRGEVTLGIQAPSEVSVVRGELLRRSTREACRDSLTQTTPPREHPPRSGWRARGE